MVSSLSICFVPSFPPSLFLALPTLLPLSTSFKRKSYFYFFVLFFFKGIVSAIVASRNLDFGMAKIAVARNGYIYAIDSENRFLLVNSHYGWCLLFYIFSFLFFISLYIYIYF